MRPFTSRYKSTFVTIVTITSSKIWSIFIPNALERFTIVNIAKAHLITIHMRLRKIKNKCIMKEDCAKKMLHVTVYASLVIQIVTGILDIYIWQLPLLNIDLAILKKLLGVEIAVQVVEGTFYGWFASSFEHVTNITPSRYYDWVLTTPSMLITLCMYLDFLNMRESSPTDNERKSKKTYPSFMEALQKNKSTIIPILLLNWMMLYFGYLGEMNVLPVVWSVILGFVPFVLYFVMIYQHYAKYTVTGQILFWTFAIIWALYGFAALMSYYVKNIMYNVLDLFAKNFFGLFLAYVVYREYQFMV